MKIIGSFFEQFEGSTVLGPYADNVHTASAGDWLIVAESTGAISAHSVENPGDAVPLFQAANDPVSAVHHVKSHDAILTIEHDGSRNIVMVYTGWREGQQLQQLQLMHPGNCSCISSCPVTGHLIVGSAARVTVHLLTEAPALAEDDPQNTVHTSELLSFVPLDPPMHVRMCNGVVAYCSEADAYALRIGLEATDAPSAAMSVPPQAGAVPETSDQCTVIGFSHNGAPWQGLQTLALGLPGPGFLNVNPSVRYGPQQVANLNLRVAAGANYALTRLELLLHQTCPEESAFHTLDLIPVCDLAAGHLARGGISGHPADAIPKAPPPGGAARGSNALVFDDDRLSGVHCFVSNERRGWMHSLSGRPSLVSEYVYNLSDEVTYARASDTVMFCAMDDGRGESSVHAMSIRTLAPSKLDDGLPKVPEVLYYGVKPLGGIRITDMTTSPSHLAITHVDQPTGGSGTGAAPGGKHSVTMFKRVSTMNLYEQMSHFAQTTPKQHPNVQHMLFDAQYLLRLQTSHKLLAGEDCGDYIALLRKSCAVLADQQREAKPPVNWLRVSSQYLAADTPLEQVVASMAPKGYEGRAPWTCAKEDMGAAHSLGVILEQALVSTNQLERTTDPVKMARILLHMVFVSRLQDLAALIIQLSTRPEFVVVLKTEGKTARTCLKDGFPAATRTPDQKLALGLLELHLDSVPQAAVPHLLADKTHLVASCLSFPALLLNGALADPQLPSGVPTLGAKSGMQVDPETAGVLTPLATFLQQFAPELLFDIAVGMGDALTAATGLVLLGPERASADPSPLIQYLQTHASRPAPLPSPDLITTVVTQTVWMFLRRLIDPEKNGRLPTLAKLGNRHGWLDALPPFAMGYAPGPGTTAEALGTLRQLQAYLCKHLSRGNAGTINDMVSSMSDDVLPGQLSLLLLCQQALGRNIDALERLMEHNPGLSLQFLLSCGVGESEERRPALWPTALDILLRRIVEATALEGQAAAHGVMPAERPRVGRPTLPSREEYTKAYAAVLAHAAASFDALTFLDMLPDQGDIGFFLPYLDRCCRQNDARSLAQDIEKEAQQIGSS